MSNPISLYVGEIQTIAAKLKSYHDDVDKDEDYELPFENILDEGHDTDYQLQDLGQLVEAKKAGLDEASFSFLRSMVWDWIDEEPWIDLDVDRDALGVNAIVSNASLQSMNLQRIDVGALAKTLFSNGVCWSTEEELANYLSIWHKAFSTALEKGHGVVLKVWV